MKRMILFSILVLFLVACDTSTQGPHTWIDRPLNGDQFEIEPVTLQARQPIR